MTMLEHTDHEDLRFGQPSPQDIADETGCGCGSGCGCHSGGSSHQDASLIDEEEYYAYGGFGLGFIRPTAYIPIKEGDHVVNISCGVGIDSLMAREIVGMKGKVTGIESSVSLVRRARTNVETLGFNNVEIREGCPEEIPVSDKSAQAVISNMGLANVKDKSLAFSEAYRIMKHHSHLCFTDLVSKGDMPAAMAEDAGMFMGSAGGVLKLEDYLKTIEEAGFEEIILHEEMKLELPDAMLHYYLPPEEAQVFRDGEPGIYSIVVSAAKPCCHAGEEDHVCCGNH